MNDKANLLHRYQNGETLVELYNDGTKIRYGEGESEYPESMDIKITDYCDAGCAWCHENSTPKGVHGDLESLFPLLSQLPPGTELAIGGGNPMAHPALVEFLEEMKSNNIICNLTVNELHFESEKKRLERLVSDNLVYGVGYSYSTKSCDWDYDNLVTHLIVGLTSPYNLHKVIENNVGKVLLLGYKYFRRGQNYSKSHSEMIDNNIKDWYRLLFSKAKEAQLSFDNLAITQLNPSRLFVNQKDYDTFYMGDDGTRTMYFDAVQKQFAPSSTSTFRHQIQGDELMSDVFNKIKMFKKVEQ